MNKSGMEIELYENLKDNLEFDFDVISMVKILKKILQKDKKEAILAWTYLLDNYSIKDLKEDIDFSPLIKDFSEILIKDIGIEEFLKIRESLKEDNQFWIDFYVFNCYDENAGIKEIMEELIKSSLQDKEKEILWELYKEKNKFHKEFFDISDLLRLVVLLHIKYKKVDLDFLVSLIEGWELKEKNKALLYTLLIDYI